MQLSYQINNENGYYRISVFYTPVFQIKKDNSTSGNTDKCCHLQIIFLANYNFKLNLQKKQRLKNATIKYKIGWAFAIRL